MNDIVAGRELRRRRVVHVRMTGQQQLQPGDFVATRTPDHGDVISLHGIVADLRSVPLSDIADLSNVIPFARARRPAIETTPPPFAMSDGERPAPPPLRERSHWIAVVVGSILVHSFLLLGLWDNPIPLASIGVEAITAEVVLGADTPAGLALTPSENEVQAATPVEAARPDDQVSEQQPERTTEQQPVKPDETRDQRPVEEREVVPEVRQQQRITAEQPELAPQETREQLVAEQVEVAAVQTPQEPPREIESDKTVMTVEPLRDLPQEVKPVARPKPSTQKSKASAAASPSMPSTASSGVGRGRSDAVSNYSGLIVAHLARYKRYPTAARSNGVRGSGAVTFTIDGGGRVTSASVSRSTGSPLLDEELTAMVQRASPFPVPPGALSKTFTAPVFFQFK